SEAKHLAFHGWDGKTPRLGGRWKGAGGGDLGGAKGTRSGRGELLYITAGQCLKFRLQALAALGDRAERSRKHGIGTKTGGAFRRIPLVQAVDRPRILPAGSPLTTSVCHVSRRTETRKGRAVPQRRRVGRRHPERGCGRSLADLPPGYEQVDLDHAPPAV